MTRTAIEWTDATWNPVTGCTKISEGCRHCYAERLFPRVYPGRDFGWVRCHPDRLEQPRRWKQPRRVFVNSMSDLFHEDVSDGFLDRVFAVMALAPQHTFQILTKRPGRMQVYFERLRIDDLALGGLGVLHSAAAPFLGDRVSDEQWEDLLSGGDWPLPNVWLGVSVEDQKTADERIPLLLDTPAALHFVSVEPVLGPVNLGLYLTRDYVFPMPGVRDPLPGLKWIIVGGESGPKARPCDIEWLRQIVRHCRLTRVPCFVKQDSGRTPGHQGRIPDELWLKEMPNRQTKAEGAPPHS